FHNVSLPRSNCLPAECRSNHARSDQRLHDLPSTAHGSALSTRDKSSPSRSCQSGKSLRTCWSGYLRSIEGRSWPTTALFWLDFYMLSVTSCTSRTGRIPGHGGSHQRLRALHWHLRDTRYHPE